MKMMIELHEPIPTALYKDVVEDKSIVKLSYYDEDLKLEKISEGVLWPFVESEQHSEEWLDLQIVKLLEQGFTAEQIAARASALAETKSRYEAQSFHRRHFQFDQYEPGVS